MTKQSQTSIDWKTYYSCEHEVHRFLPDLDPNERYRAFLVESLMPRERLDSMLDAGCGDGSQCEYFSARFRRVVGCDISLSRVQFAQQHSPNAKFLSAALPDLPFRPRSFDIVTLCEVLEHMEEPVVVLRQLATVSRRYLLVTVPYKQPPQIILCPHCLKPFPIDGHLHIFDERKLRDTLERAGLRIVKVERYFSPSPWESALPIRLLRPAGKRFVRHLLQRLSLITADNAVFIGALCEVQ